jgi:hypothetical protein
MQLGAEISRRARCALRVQGRRQLPRPFRLNSSRTIGLVDVRHPHVAFHEFEQFVKVHDQSVIRENLFVLQ